MPLGAGRGSNQLEASNKSMSLKRWTARLATYDPVSEEMFYMNKGKEAPAQGGFLVINDANVGRKMAYALKNL
jgi:hypothetical protein